MATIRAGANGNWSSSSTWIGGVVPTSADDVVANSFTVQVDGSYTVLSLRNDTLGGATSGGGFVFSTNNVTLIATSIVATVTGLISITSTTGTITITCSNNIGGIATSSSNIISHTGGCDVIINVPNIVANRSGSVTNSVVISKNSSGLLTVNGNVAGGASNGGSSNTAITCSGGDLVIVGNVTTATSGSATTSCFAINQSNGKLTIIGSVTGGGVISSTGYAINHSSSSNLEITGDVLGGGVAAAINKTTGSIIVTGNVTGATLSAIIGTPISITIIGNALGAGAPSILITGTGVIDITGTVTASSTAVGIQSAGLVKLSGNAVNTNRYMAIYAPQVTIDTTTTSWKFQQFAGADITLYASGASLGNPIQDDVRFGTAYGPSGTLTGTLRVPNPNAVLLGNLTDDTTGTLIMTPQGFWDFLTSGSTLIGSFGKLIKDFLDVAVSSRLASTSYTAPDNTSIAAIKSKTDTIDWVNITDIKTKTDKIPDFPASVQTTGDQIASYIT